MAPALPHIFSGTVLDDDNVTPRGSVSMTMTNERTLETTSTTTNAAGGFILNTANFASGYTEGDYVVISTNSSGANGNDLRIRVIARGVGQIDEIRVDYDTRA